MKVSMCAKGDPGLVLDTHKTRHSCRLPWPRAARSGAEFGKEQKCEQTHRRRQVSVGERKAPRGKFGGLCREVRGIKDGGPARREAAAAAGRRTKRGRVWAGKRFKDLANSATRAPRPGREARRLRRNGGRQRSSEGEHEYERRGYLTTLDCLSDVATQDSSGWVGTRMGVNEGVAFIRSVQLLIPFLFRLRLDQKSGCVRGVLVFFFQKTCFCFLSETLHHLRCCRASARTAKEDRSDCCWRLSSLEMLLMPHAPGARRK